MAQIQRLSTALARSVEKLEDKYFNLLFIEFKYLIRENNRIHISFDSISDFLPRDVKEDHCGVNIDTVDIHQPVFKMLDKNVSTPVDYKPGNNKKSEARCISFHFQDTF